MAKMTDKKPAKAKPKVKHKVSGKAKAPSAQPQSATLVVPAVRQPGVERPQEPPDPRQGRPHADPADAGRRARRPAGRPGPSADRLRRNYLLPQGLATFATPHNLRIVEKHRQRLREVEEARRADLMNLAAQIAQRSITIEANANPEGHLYGSVNADQIAAALKTDNFPIEADNVKIEGPLKETGLYTIKLNLGQDVTTEVKLWVVPTHTEEVAT